MDDINRKEHRTMSTPASDLKPGDAIVVDGEEVTVTEVKPFGYGLYDVHYQGAGFVGTATMTTAERPS